MAVLAGEQHRTHTEAMDEKGLLLNSHQREHRISRAADKQSGPRPR